jgi:hypothetical protein
VPQFERIVDTALKIPPTFHILAEFGGGFIGSLCVLGIVPEIGRGDQDLQVRKLFFLRSEVKDAPEVGLWLPGLRSNVRSDPAFHPPKVTLA